MLPVFFGSLLYVSVLLINAVAILSEDRFLARVNLSPGSHQAAFGAGPMDASVRSRIITLISSVRTIMRIPLIAINTFIILWELALG